MSLNSYIWLPIQFVLYFDLLIFVMIMSVRLELLKAWCYKLLLKFCSYKQTLKTIGDILEIYDQRQVTHWAELSQILKNHSNSYTIFSFGKCAWWSFTQCE